MLTFFSLLSVPRQDAAIDGGIGPKEMERMKANQRLTLIGESNQEKKDNRALYVKIKLLNKCVWAKAFTCYSCILNYESDSKLKIGRDKNDRHK